MKKIIFSVVILLVICGITAGVLSNKKNNSASIQSNGLYVAMGDSVAAGAGLGNALDSSACDRSKSAYPQLVADALHYSLKDVACSDATIPAGISGGQTVNRLTLPSQLDQLYGSAAPNLITMTIGANDSKWLSISAKCINSSCGSEADSSEVQQNVATMQANLRAVLSSIQQHYQDKTPTVAIVGYYKLVTGDSSTCSDVSGIDAGEKTWINQQADVLNNGLEQVASEFNFSKFIPIDFTGHQLCSDAPYLQGILDKVPYHPNKDGQAVIAKQITDKIGAK